MAQEPIVSVLSTDGRLRNITLPNSMLFIDKEAAETSLQNLNTLVEQQAELLKQVQAELFCGLEAEDLIKGASPAATKLIAIFNRLANHVTYTILEALDPEQQYGYLMLWVSQADYCSRMGDHASAAAIIAGLSTSVIRNGKFTAAAFKRQPNVKKRFDALAQKYKLVSLETISALEAEITDAEAAVPAVSYIFTVFELMKTKFGDVSIPEQAKKICEKADDATSYHWRVQDERGRDEKEYAELRGLVERNTTLSLEKTDHYLDGLSPAQQSALLTTIKVQLEQHLPFAKQYLNEAIRDLPEAIKTPIEALLDKIIVTAVVEEKEITSELIQQYVDYLVKVHLAADIDKTKKYITFIDAQKEKLQAWQAEQEKQPAQEEQLDRSFGVHEFIRADALLLLSHLTKQLGKRFDIQEMSSDALGVIEEEIHAAIDQCDRNQLVDALQILIQEKFDPSIRLMQSHVDSLQIDRILNYVKSYLSQDRKKNKDKLNGLQTTPDLIRDDFLYAVKGASEKLAPMRMLIKNQNARTLAFSVPLSGDEIKDIAGSKQIKKAAKELNSLLEHLEPGKAEQWDFVDLVFLCHHLKMDFSTRSVEQFLRSYEKKTEAEPLRIDDFLLLRVQIDHPILRNLAFSKMRPGESANTFLNNVELLKKIDQLNAILTAVREDQKDVAAWPNVTQLIVLFNDLRIDMQEEFIQTFLYDYNRKNPNTPPKEALVFNHELIPPDEAKTQLLELLHSKTVSTHRLAEFKPLFHSAVYQQALYLKQLQAEHFKAIPIEEVQAGRGPHVSAALNIVNRLFRDIMTSMVQEKNSDRRISQFIYWFKLLETSAAIGDFATASAIFSALNSSTIANMPAIKALKAKSMNIENYLDLFGEKIKASQQSLELSLTEQAPRIFLLGPYFSVINATIFGLAEEGAKQTTKIMKTLAPLVDSWRAGLGGEAVTEHTRQQLQKEISRSTQFDDTKAKKLVASITDLEVTALSRALFDARTRVKPAISALAEKRPDIHKELLTLMEDALSLFLCAAVVEEKIVTKDDIQTYLIALTRYVLPRNERYIDILQMIEAAQDEIDLSVVQPAPDQSIAKKVTQLYLLPQDYRRVLNLWRDTLDNESIPSNAMLSLMKTDELEAIVTEEIERADAETLVKLYETFIKPYAYGDVSRVGFLKYYVDGVLLQTYKSEPTKENRKKFEAFDQKANQAYETKLFSIAKQEIIDPEKKKKVSVSLHNMKGVLLHPSRDLLEGERLQVQSSSSKIQQSLEIPKGHNAVQRAAWQRCLTSTRVIEEAEELIQTLQQLDQSHLVRESHLQEIQEQNRLIQIELDILQALKEQEAASLGEMEAQIDQRIQLLESKAKTLEDLDMKLQMRHIEFADELSVSALLQKHTRLERVVQEAGEYVVLPKEAKQSQRFKNPILDIQTSKVVYVNPESGQHNPGREKLAYTALAKVAAEKFKHCKTLFVHSGTANKLLSQAEAKQVGLEIAKALSRILPKDKKIVLDGEMFDRSVAPRERGVMTFFGGKGKGDEMPTLIKHQPVPLLEQPMKKLQK